MKRLLVCDLDNTLYDWVDYFVTAFYAMVDEAVRITGCDREQLLDDFRTVHRKHHDAEHPFALLETSTIAKIFPGQSRRQVARQLDAAFHAFNTTRKARLRLYPGVRETLDVLSSSDIKIVAHTESKLYGMIDRLSRLNITHYFGRIYCRERPRAEHPDPTSGSRWLSQFPLHKVVELSHHQRKPDPDVLLEICRREGCSPEESAYVGDSMARDMLMARMAGVSAIWAKYGTSDRKESYEKLVRITHWTEEDVVRERQASAMARGIQPDFVLELQFSEIAGVLLPSGVRSAAAG